MAKVHPVLIPSGSRFAIIYSNENLSVKQLTEMLPKQVDDFCPVSFNILSIQIIVNNESKN